MLLYSTEFLSYPTNSSLVYVPEATWIRTMDSLQCKRIFAAMTFHDGTVVYGPVSATEGEGDGLYVPLWMIPAGQEMGSEISVEFLPEEAFPEALRIVLRPLDSAFYSVNAEEELTQVLTTLGVLKKGSIVSVKLSGLGGYPMEFYIVDLEPAEIVLCSGDEVVIEFEEAVDQWDGRPPTPPPPPPQVLTPAPAHAAPAHAAMPMVPVEGDAAGGRLLGGGTVRRMPDGRPWNPWREVERYGGHSSSQR